MGANDDSRFYGHIKEDDHNAVAKQFDIDCDAACYDQGHDAYGGHIGTRPGIDQWRTTTTADKAYEMLWDNDKWSGAVAIWVEERSGWLVGGMYPS